ncbi:hypothetical protein BGZ82_011112 [Podila clonocystis]|nr:hypothetical protein BGZ82_011112 [Podila clonocystis]
MAKPSLFLRSPTTILTLLISSFIATLASAQSPSPSGPVPEPKPSPPSAFLGITSATSDKFIYYQGGQLNLPTVQYSGELFSLDVTKPWPISSPAWTNLTVTTGVGGPLAIGHSATVSRDQSTLYVTAPTGNTSDPFFYEYNIQSATWSTTSAPLAQAPVWAVRREAHLLTDPKTGAIWYLGGSIDKGETNEIDKFLNGGWSINLATTQVDPTSGDVKAYVMNRFSSGTSHIYQNKIYFFGGFTSTPDGHRSYQSFQSIPTIDISTPQLVYAQQFTIGTVPKPRNDHCSVLTASQKIIIYGGYDSNTKYTFNDVWSLDLVTMTWTQIVASSSARYSHTCNLAGANMIVFGGRASATATSKDVGYRDVQVYDVTTSTWMQNYTVKEDTTPMSQPLPGSTSGAPNKGLSTGAIVGVIVGVLGVILMVGGLILYQRRQKKFEVHEAEMEKAAYLASLGSDAEGKNHARRASQRYHKNNPYSASSPRSPSTRPLNGAGTSTMNSPTLGYGSGFESLETPTVPGASNVQYLMQHLPDGTIAVQPVYLDHQPIPLQHSPNMMYSENSSLGGDEPQHLSERSVYVNTSPTHGLGIFARDDLAPNTVWWYPQPETTLCVQRDLYHRIRMASKHHHAWSLVLDAIDMFSYYDRHQDVLVFCLCNARYCNHDDTPNSVPVAATLLGDSPRYGAIHLACAVKKDQEIFESYRIYGHLAWARTCGDFLNPQLGDTDKGFEDEVIQSGLMEIVLTREQVATYLRSHRQTDIQRCLEVCWKEFGVAENGGWRIAVPEAAREP